MDAKYSLCGTCAMVHVSPSLKYTWEVDYVDWSTMHEVGPNQC